MYITTDLVDNVNRINPKTVEEAYFYILEYITKIVNKFLNQVMIKSNKVTIVEDVPDLVKIILDYIKANNTPNAEPNIPKYILERVVDTIANNWDNQIKLYKDIRDHKFKLYPKLKEISQGLDTSSKLGEIGF